MSDPAPLQQTSESSEKFNNMTTAEFEARLPDLLTSTDGKLIEDPRFAAFFAANPDCAALVRDLEAIAEAARKLFEPVDEPSDAVWNNIASKLQSEPSSLDEPNDVLE